MCTRNFASITLLGGLVALVIACSSGVVSESSEDELRTGVPAPAPSGSTYSGDPGDGGDASEGGDADADEGGGFSGPACYLDTGSASCNSCTEYWCCAQMTQCGLDADCRALVDCLDECANAPTGSCASSCRQRFAAGEELLESVEMCLGETCSSECSK